IKELRSQIQDLEEQKVHLQEEISEPIQVEVSTIKYYATDLQQLLLAGSIPEQRSFLRSFIRQVIVPGERQGSPVRGTIEYTLPLAPKELREAGVEVGSLVSAEVLPFVRVGSPGRTRTCDQPVTRIPIFRKGLDYLFTRLRNRRGCRALMRRYRSAPQPLVSARSCLLMPSTGFAQDYRSAHAGTASLNSPDVSTTVSCGSCSSEWISRWQFAQRSMHLSSSSRIFAQLRV